MSQASSENLPRRVLLTGATSTIGKEIARKLAESGCEVWAMGRDAEALAQLVSSLPGSSHHSLEADLLDSSSLEKALAKLESESKEIGGFVHAAAWGTSRPASQVSSQHLENAFRVTAKGFFSSASACLPCVRPEGCRWLRFRQRARPEGIGLPLITLAQRLPSSLTPELWPSSGPIEDAE